MLVSTHMESPVGRLTLVASEVGLRAILWAEEDPSRVPLDHPPSNDPDHPVLTAAAQQLVEYFDGDRQAFELPLDAEGTDFQQAVWAELQRIPYGDTVTYGDIAGSLGSPELARAVGAANGRNPLSIVIPCHRVIGSDGSLTGFAGGVEKKAWLLGHEQGVRTLL